jgi:DNA polymerase III alpha subunit
MRPWRTAPSSNGTRTTSTKLGILKVDVLGLGMLTCIRKCFELIAGWHG